MVANDDVYSLINYTNFIYFICIILAIGGLAYMKIKGQTENATIHVPMIVRCSDHIYFNPYDYPSCPETPY